MANGTRKKTGTTTMKATTKDKAHTISQSKKKANIKVAVAKRGTHDLDTPLSGTSNRVTIEDDDDDEDEPEYVGSVLDADGDVVMEPEGTHKDGCARDPIELSDEEEDADSELSMSIESGLLLQHLTDSGHY